ncbi:MAG: GNAT family N-acetyltransferase [Candidatus Obscuribacterales bacterium]|nr:GNAT family N-acetyltransferase [Candidatus Obscuribacterales bacterium]
MGMFQEILTERLRLRRFQPEDAEAVYAYRTTPELRQFLSWPQSMEVLHSTINNLSSKDFCSAAGWDQLAIEHCADQQLLGDCAIRIDEMDSRIAELGIALAAEFQLKGQCV